MLNKNILATSIVAACLSFGSFSVNAKMSDEMMGKDMMKMSDESMMMSEKYKKEGKDDMAMMYMHMGKMYDMMYKMMDMMKNEMPMKKDMMMEESK